MSDVLSGAQELLCEAAAEDDSDPLLLLEALDCILEKAQHLTTVGWHVSGGELLSHILPLYDRAHAALDGAVVEIDSATFEDGREATDAEVIAHLGAGEVSMFDGSRWWLADVHVQLRNRLVELQNVQARAGVLVVADGEGGYGFQLLERDA